jgi:hypothetical protein
MQGIPQFSFRQRVAQPRLALALALDATADGLQRLAKIVAEPASNKGWEAHSTWALTYWRRRRWWGWQTRKMTDAELRAHFETKWRR